MPRYIHEYAGFKYIMTLEDGRYRATPVEGQHPNVWKDKHRRAAVETYLQENPSAAALVTS